MSQIWCKKLAKVFIITELHSVLRFDCWFENCGQSRKASTDWNWGQGGTFVVWAYLTLLDLGVLNLILMGNYWYQKIAKIFRILKLISVFWSESWFGNCGPSQKAATNPRKLDLKKWHFVFASSVVFFTTVSKPVARSQKWK